MLRFIDSLTSLGYYLQLGSFIREEKAIEDRHKHESGFPEIVEEDEKFDPDDNPQMTMKARSQLF